MPDTSEWSKVSTSESKKQTYVSCCGEKYISFTCTCNMINHVCDNLRLSPAYYGYLDNRLRCIVLAEYKAMIEDRGNVCFTTRLPTPCLPFISSHCNSEDQSPKKEKAALKVFLIGTDSCKRSFRLKQGWPMLLVTSYMSWKSFILRPMASTKSSTRWKSSLMFGPIWENRDAAEKAEWKKRDYGFIEAEYCE